jgi:ribosome recycling factor
MADPDLDDVERRMDKALAVLKQELAGLRTGRASPHLLDMVKVHAYGADMPINQVGTVNVPEPRLITVQVWDKANIKAVDKAIREASLGLNPQIDGQLLRIPIPELTEERRKELIKIAHQYTEQARVAVRNIRRDGMEMLKKMQRDGELGEDDHKFWHDEVQKMTDAHIGKIDEITAAKEKEIRHV